MVSNGFPNVIISGRNPPLYCTFITLITYIQGHQNTNKEHRESRYTVYFDLRNVDHLSKDKYIYGSGSKVYGTVIVENIFL